MKSSLTDVINFGTLSSHQNGRHLFCWWHCQMKSLDITFCMVFPWGKINNSISLFQHYFRHLLVTKSLTEPWWFNSLSIYMSTNLNIINIWTLVLSTLCECICDFKVLPRIVFSDVIMILVLYPISCDISQWCNLYPYIQHIIFLCMMKYHYSIPTI